MIGRGVDQVREWLIDHTAQWHDTWEIVGVVFTGAAVAVALILGLHDSRARARAQEAELDRLRLERDEARRERDAAERAEAKRLREVQARKVMIRVDGYQHDRTTGWSIDVQVRNYSGMPVFDLLVHLRDWNADDAQWRTFQEELGPNERLTYRVAVKDASRREKIAKDVVVDFTDISGNVWSRQADGVLVESLRPAP